MKRNSVKLLSALLILLFCLPAVSALGELSGESEYAWVLAEINDHKNEEKWAAADAHVSYIVKYGYSRGVYTASTTYEGDDQYGEGKSGTLAVKAVFSGVPDIIYPDKPVSLRFSFVPTENSVVLLSFSAYAGADFDQWDVKPGGVTGSAVSFTDSDGATSFTINSRDSKSFDKTLTAALGSGSEDSRIALRLKFSMGVSMGTNYVYEWKQVTEAMTMVPTTGSSGETDFFQPTTQPTTQATTAAPSESGAWWWPWSGEEAETEDPSFVYDPDKAIVRFGDIHGEVNVKRAWEDDDAWVYAEMNTPLRHGDMIKTLPKSGAILSFSDMSTYVMKEDTIIVLDIKNERETKIGIVTGKIWTNLKKMVEDGTMEVEMAQAVCGIKGTTFICEEVDGVSVLKVFEGTVEYTSKASGETVNVSGGQMITADSAGLGKPVSFDMDAELETWDENVQQLTTQALADNKDGSGIVVILIIAAVVAALAVAVAIVLIKKRKPASSHSPFYPPATVPQSPSEQSINGNPAPAKWCTNCGSPTSPESKFCAKCGQPRE